MTTSVTLDRTSLTLTDLVITGNAPAGAGFFLALDGVAEPAFDVRSTYAPDSAYVAGSLLLSAVLGASTLPLVVGVVASTTAALAALKAELAAATYQFTYTLTLTVDGVAQVWDAGPAYPVWGDLVSGFVDQHIQRAAVVIPVNPAGA